MASAACASSASTSTASRPTPNASYDPAQESPQRFGVKAMPSAVLIGADGRVLRLHAGFRDEQRAELEAAIAQALAARR